MLVAASSGTNLMMALYVVVLSALGPSRFICGLNVFYLFQYVVLQSAALPAVRAPPHPATYHQVYCRPLLNPQLTDCHTG